MTEDWGDLLVFQVDGAVFGVDAALVRETLWLPELAPAVAAPSGVVGLLNLRGDVLPVLDLAARLGRGSRQPHAGDQLVVIEVDGTPAALAVSQVRDLVPRSAGQPLAPPDYGKDHESPLITGTLQLAEDLVHVLDARGLLIAGAAGSTTIPPAGREPEMTPLEETRRRDLARALRQPVVPESQSRGSLAVVALGDRWFGIDLLAVREFCILPEVSPLPCCPPHIAGVFNLRGRLVTLLEMASALSLPTPDAPRPKAVIASLGDEPVGVAVDDILDVFNPTHGDLEPPPANLQQREIVAVTTFNGRRVTVLDLPGLLALDTWVVDDTVR